MEEQASNNAVGEPAPAPRKNAGWFQRGDQRINRGGRPRKEWAAFTDRAPRADRLMLLWVPTRDFGQRLTRDHASRIVNLPQDYQIVGCRLDAARDSLALTIRSEAFERIARGQPIPEFTPEIAQPADRAPSDDNLMVTWMSDLDLLYRLEEQFSSWMVNLPEDCEIVSARLDSARKAVAFVIRSQSFDTITKGTMIPEFVPEFHGRKWRRAGPKTF